MSQNRTSLIVTFVEPYLSLVSSRGFVVCPTDMIRRPSGVTATQFSLGFIDSARGVPCASGILRRSRPSSMRQMKSVASP